MRIPHFTALAVALLLISPGVARAQAGPAAAPTADTPPADSLYNRSIALPPDAGQALKDAAADAAAVLQKMTGQAFPIVPDYNARGIWLLKSSDERAPADARKWLAGRQQEPFFFRADANQLLIVANGEKGLVHGLYYYLEQLGVRFYLPNENWTVIPPKQNITLKLQRQVAPDFSVRTFFGTGGFGSPNRIDPKLEIRSRWARWQARNRFGGEFSPGGHSGEAFNAQHKEILLQHPEYLAKVNGKHVPWSPGAKLNTANPDAVKLYVDWTVERFRKMRAADPAAFAVTVDPSDGGGHCNSDECKAIGNGSASDQVFFVANAAARAVRREFPDGWVNLYGYNEHAMPPSIAVEPNVFVQIIPYAFQTTGMGADEFIAAWGAKIKRMGLYDYWSIPDWTHDEPSFNYLGTPAHKLGFWRRNNIEAFSAESTHSAGAMGIGWFLAARQMWDVKTDQKALLDDFYQGAFAEARPPMQRMLERWATSFKPTGYELAASYRDLQRAGALAKTPAARARVADFGRYVEYLRLRLEWQSATKDNKAAAHAALVDHLWDIYPSAMVHSFRIYQLLTRGDAATKARYEAKDATGWADVRNPSDEEVFAAIDAGAKNYQPLDFTPQKFTSELVPAGPQPLAVPAAADEKVPSIFLVGPTAMQLQALPGQKTLPLRIDGNVRVQLLDTAGKVVFDKPVAGAGNWEEFKRGDKLQEIQVPIPAAGRYQLLLKMGKNDRIHFQAPRGFLLTMQHFRCSMPLRSPRVYFWVPHELKTLAIYSPHAADSRYFDPQFQDAQGRPVPSTAHDGGRVYTVKIPAGQDGQVWSMTNLLAPNYPIEMLNAPQAFALYPDSLLVPQDAL